MKAETVTEANGRNAHVKGEPTVDHPYVNVQLVFADKDKPDDIDRRRGDAEPDEESCAAHHEETHKCKHHYQDRGVDRKCKFSDLLLYHR